MPRPARASALSQKYNDCTSLNELPLIIAFDRWACCVIGGSHLAGLHGDLVEVSEVLTHDLGHPGRSGKTVMEVSVGRPGWHALLSFLKPLGHFTSRNAAECSRMTMVSNLSAMRVANYLQFF